MVQVPHARRLQRLSTVTNLLTLWHPEDNPVIAPFKAQAMLLGQ